MITKKLLFTILLIASLSLSGISSAIAADVGIVQTNNVSINNESVNTHTENIDTIKSTTTPVNIDSNTKAAQTNINTSPKTETSKNITTNQTTSQVKTVNTVSSQTTGTNQYAAAGEIGTTLSTSFTIDQIKDAAARVKVYIETNKRLPNYVTIGTNQVIMPDFLKLLTSSLLQINSGITAPIQLKTVGNSTQPAENIISGNIYKADYLDLAKRVNTFIDTYGVLPNYANTPLGQMRYENLIYTFSKIVNFQKVNNYLPNYVSVKPWTSIATSVITQARTVYLTSDYINGYTTDMNRLNTITNALRSMGLTVINYGIGPNTHYSVLQTSGIPANALIVDIYGGACAGTIWEMGTSYYKQLVGSKEVFCVWMPPSTDITGLAWLPRAWDDNFSPASFTGLANPDQYLINNGYSYIYSANLNTIISAIYQKATS